MSSLPSDLPRMPKWPFFLFDALLLATASVIAWNHTGTLTGVPLIAVTACVLVAAVLCAIPLIVDYARVQDEALDERQRALEALSRTVANSAEQIGIAAQGLASIAESTQKSLRLAEHLPQKLQEKFGDLQERVDSSKDEVIDELERELAALRTVEGDRLETAADKIHKLAAEFTKIEANTARHLSAATDVFAKSESFADKAAVRMHQAADESAAKVSVALTRTLAAAQETTASTLDAEQKRVLGAISEKLDTMLAALDAHSSKAAGTIESKIAMLEAVVSNLKTAVVEASRVSIQGSEPSQAHESTGISETHSASKRSKKARREESEIPAKTEIAQPLEQSESQDPVVIVEELPSPVAAGEEATSAVQSEPQPEQAAEVPANLVPEAVVPATPESEPLQKAQSDDQPGVAVADPKVPSRNHQSEELSLDLGEYSQVSPEEAASSTSVSADGATRLIVTAYIGIGNRLYIRGDGPGLSWEKGVALQFVSIGKWRWESAEALGPVHLKLLKNDQTECASIGELVLSPGHQAEVTASF